MENSGSRWLRWEPHIHAPGTVLNDQFKGTDTRADYLARIEAATPQIRALGVTDYYLLDTYEEIRAAKFRDNRLPGVDLIFPNVELRLAFGTVKGNWVNCHLLVNPEAADHVQATQRFLAQLTFDAFGDRFTCTPEDLTRLGEKVDASLSGRAALARGATQFKVNFDQLVEVYRAVGWAHQNILIAVAGSEHDGTSGMRGEAEGAQRQEVEKFAHVIFSSSPSQRDYWLGRKTTEDDIRTRYGGLKPCLHGSDAHEPANIGVPDGDRFSWVKGGAHFDSLKQAVIDPSGRAYVGTAPPTRATPSQVIVRVTLNDADWAYTPQLDLNPGLVAIIGARGSGKTALADAIAAGSDAASGQLSAASFLVRAGDLLSDVSVRLDWGSGDPSERALLDYEYDPELDGRFARALYLSQKFVEELCSADGMTDALLAEIERVIFEAHPEKDGTFRFDQLLELRANRHRLAREREEEAIISLSDQIGLEREKRRRIAGLKQQLSQKEQTVKGLEADRDKLIVKGSEARAASLTLIANAAEKVRSYVRYYVNQESALLSLHDEAAGDPGPWRQQGILGRSRSDADALRDIVRDYALETLSDPDAVLVIDETGFLKQGKASCGVARQYTGSAGKITNCQIGVFAAYVSRHGHAFIDRALYLPKAWTDDPARMKLAHVPEGVGFATKPALALAMIERAMATQVPFSWVAADSVYGVGDIETALRRAGKGYVLGVNANHPFRSWAKPHAVAGTAKDIAETLPTDAWQRLSCGEGTKGARLHDWVYLELADLDAGEYNSALAGLWTRGLLIRRNIADGDLAFFSTWGPAGTGVETFLKVEGHRWAIEDSFETAKNELGLDHNETRSWHGWHRHVSLVMLAFAMMAAIRHHANATPPKTMRRAKPAIRH